MNRIASLLAGTLTTALSGAAVAGFAASQGVFESASSPAQAATTDVADASPVVAATSAPVTESPPVATRIVYVDKEPVVYTQDVKVPASASTSSAATGQSGGSPVPAATSAATVPPAPEGLAKPKSEGPTVPAVTPAVGAPMGPSPDASPATPAAAAPAAAPKATETPSTGTGGHEVHKDDHPGDKHTEPEDDRSGGEHE